MLLGGLIINNLLRLVQMIMQEHTSHCDFFTPHELKLEGFITQQSWQSFLAANLKFLRLCNCCELTKVILLLANTWFHVVEGRS